MGASVAQSLHTKHLHVPMGGVALWQHTCPKGPCTQARAERRILHIYLHTYSACPTTPGGAGKALGKWISPLAKSSHTPDQQHRYLTIYVVPEATAAGFGGANALCHYNSWDYPWSYKAAFN